MNKAERNRLRKPRSIKAGDRTRDEIREMGGLADQEERERRALDPIRPRPKRGKAS